ncbi:GNAT family N-acetyltransferase [Microbacterium sp. SSW1-49]|uniref:GNAT family N-acetyltransferase n=1 Tax=Microbacterium croceum TaxID=2851645 RepID=A0ABT0F9N7_9MICO|nr:GNAT family N-acetyltransferase [Microbacterium croceum]MCK2034770.1 GNAT family N-acetyltransferase [Microbacterium croceum]
MEWTLRPSAPADAAWIAELRAVVLRDDLTRLGRFDEVRVRQRFLDSFRAEATRVIVVDGADAGSIAVRSDDDVQWIEHFYLDPALQGRGIGGAVLERVLSDAAGQTFRLNVLQGSPALRLYLRAGFLLDSEDPVDMFLTRPAR